MADNKPSLAARVAWYLSRGYNDLQAINAIRNKGTSRSINVRFIKAQIATYRQSVTAASALGNSSPSTPVKKVLKKDNVSDSGSATVSFHFQFDFTGARATSRSGRQSVYMTVEVPISTTKGDLTKQLQELAREWIAEHYQSDPEGRTNIRIIIDTIKGI